MTQFCLTCQRPPSRCLCSFVQPVANKTPVFILQHAKERLHPKGTAKLAQLCLSQAELIIGKEFKDTLTRIQRDYAPILLWPEENAGSAIPSATEANRREGNERNDNLTRTKPSALIAIDGTWKKAAKIYHTHAELHTLPKLNLQGHENQYHHRKSPSAEHLSTLEAIYFGLRELSHNDIPYHQTLNGLLDAQQRMIEHWHKNLELHTP
ncbi:tRNA-uridine aminocarboxypropyltransferase [Litoribrevibacter albus]|uniref:tRNA-uridine aminocarboxypropyltransferase n=1 Tax=Litoribrevibacter albus TaxID=1473156 RepID=UPI0024E0503E|nr:tRNA-uridine aminocarboxypropyltransferase [Litoribrevibacter albus]